MVPTACTMTNTNETNAVQITETIRSEIASYFTATCGKTTATVVVDTDKAAYPGIRVIVANASHRVWRGSGKFFRTTEEALNAYKSDAVRAIIFACAGAASKA